MSKKHAATAAANGHISSHGKAVVLPPNTVRHLAAGFKQQWKRYRKYLRRCQNKFSESAVHGSRVETRRLIAVLELLRPFFKRRLLDQAGTALKRHLDTFDDLRDTQVQLIAVNKLHRGFPAAEDFSRYLRKREARLLRQTRKRVRRIKTRRLATLVSEFRSELKKWRSTTRVTQANALLLKSVDAAFQRTWRLQRLIQPKHTTTIHRTRIAFKKFRYMIETLADLLPGANDKLLSAMQHYQTMMGEIQDAEVLLATFDQFAKKCKGEPRAAARLRAELARRRQWLVRVYMDAAHQLRDFWPENPDTPISDKALSAELRRSPTTLHTRAQN